MIEFKFTAPQMEPRIFKSTDVITGSHVTIPLELYIPVSELTLKDHNQGGTLQRKIIAAVEKMVEELNSETQTKGAKT